MTAQVLIIVTLLAIFFVVVGVKRPVIAFCMAAATAPWQDLMVDVGLRLTLYTLSMMGLLAAVISNCSGNWRGIVGSRIWWPLLALLLWALGGGLVQLSGAFEVQVAGGVMRSQAIRPLVQFLSLLLSLLPVLAAPFIFSSRKDLLLLGQVFMCSVILLVMLGWWQIYQVYFYGTNPLPMGSLNAWLGGFGGVARDALDLGPDATRIYRMNSLGGEPRYLAQSIATALLLLQIGWMSRTLRVEMFSLLLFVILFAALLATMAMSGLYLWLIGALALLAYFFWKRNFISRKGVLLVLLGGLIAGGGLLVLVSHRATQWNSLLDAVAYLFQRVLRRGFIADFDAAVFDFLKMEPSWLWFGVGLGNVHLHADAYLSPYIREFAGNTSFVADSGWLRLISELGLVGLCLFLWWCLEIWIALRMLESHPDWGRSVVVLIPVFLVAVVGYLARGTTYAPVAFILFAAAVVPVFLARASR